MRLYFVKLLLDNHLSLDKCHLGKKLSDVQVTYQNKKGNKFLHLVFIFGQDLETQRPRGIRFGSELPYLTILIIKVRFIFLSYFENVETWLDYDLLSSY